MFTDSIRDDDEELDETDDLDEEEDEDEEDEDEENDDDAIDAVNDDVLEIDRQAAWDGTWPDFKAKVLSTWPDVTEEELDENPDDYREVIAIIQERTGETVVTIERKLAA